MISEKTLSVTTSRNMGIDLLRIVAMFMVLFLHILGNGGILFEVAPLSAHGIVAWFFEMATFSAINCYGIISGFVGVKSHYKYTNLIMLWLQVASYCVLISLFYHITQPEVVSLNDVLMSFFPICTEKYWYVTAYAGLFFFMPLLNKGALALTKKQLLALVMGLFASLSVLPFIFNSDIFKTSMGYSLVWLAFLYLAGAYLRLYGTALSGKRWIFILTFFSCCGISWVVKLWEESVSTLGKWADIASGAVAQYTSPLMVLAGFSLVVIFSGLNLPRWLKNAVRVVSPCAFGVYIIHAHPILWHKLVALKYSHYTLYSPFGMILAVFLTALFLFVLLAFIDLVRNIIFRMLKIKPLLQKAESKLIGDLWK